jgi:predicted porin
MKNIIYTATTLVLLVAASHSNAQSSVTLYGNVDGGFAYFSNVSGRSLYTSEDGNYVPDFFGLIGTEYLGGGLKAQFKLESGYLLNSGNLTVPNQIFQREAYVGLLSDELGTLTFGHQLSFMSDVLLPFSLGYLNGGFYAFHQGNMDELAETFEFDNSIKYTSPAFKGLTFSTLLGFGNQASSFATGRNYAFSLQYKNGPLSLGTVYEDENNRFLEYANSVGLKTFLNTPLPTTNAIIANNVKNWGVGGSYAIGNWLVHGLFTQTRINLSSGSGNANTVEGGVNYTIGSFDTVGAGASVENFNGGRWVTLSLSNVYSLSKRTKIYQELMDQKASGSNAVASMLSAGPASGHSQFGVVFGIQHFF